ncbi:copper transport protein ATOX1 isoform X1 [Phascolarctos cinereus]|uniref:Copper transport protein ATOX1 n=1 Tax=Phascolarctos cinereus TaxID=38626 RepID=A0A6P5ICM1_PHACI|nr:copper transport protein ATOX1 isoform X1 [Phascolarctos cinereus]
MPKHEFSVDMTCEGCSNAVTRVLNKLGDHGESQGRCWQGERRSKAQRLSAFRISEFGNWVPASCGALWRGQHQVGVQFDIDLPNKKVRIDSEHSVETLLETLKKTGKATTYLGTK